VIRLVLRKSPATHSAAVVPTPMVSCVSARSMSLGGSVTRVNRDTGTYAFATRKDVKVSLMASCEAVEGCV